MPNVKVDFARTPKELKPFYSAVGYANVDYTYTEPTKKMYDYLSSFDNHFQYMRLHNILTAHGQGDFYLLNHGRDYGNPPGSGQFVEGDNAVVSLDQEGNLTYNWQTVDKVYDILMEHNIKPIVETVYMPTCLQKSEEDWFIPKDFSLWKQLLSEFVKHLLERYGKNEVKTWYFEIWNEPDNHQKWVENSATFLALYDYMEEAIHSVDLDLKVGGPAVKQWEGAHKIFREFLEHCAKGLNYATGKFGSRVDFISVHCKGGWPNLYNPSTEVMFDSLEKYINILQEFPEFAGIEFFNDESDIVWSGNRGVVHESWLNFRNTHYFPGFVAKMVNTYCDQIEDKYGINLSIVDSDNCHLQWERNLYSGNRSQFTPLIEYPSTDLLRKSAFNSYVLLSRLADQRYPADCSEAGFGRKFGVLPTAGDNLLSIMVWNFEDGIEDNINPREISLDLNNIPYKGTYKLIHYRIDKQYSNSYNIWDKMGKPAYPTVDQIKEIREKEGLELYQDVTEVDLKENLSFGLDLPMHSVSLLLLVPANEDQPATPEFIKAIAEKGFNRNDQVFLKWKPNQENDFLYYRLYRKEEGEKEYQLISDNTSLNTAVYTDMEVAADHKYVYMVQAITASLQASELSEVIEIEIDN